MFIPEWLLWTGACLVVMSLGSKWAKQLFDSLCIGFVCYWVYLSVPWGVVFGAGVGGLVSAAAFLLVYVGIPWVTLGFIGHSVAWLFKKLGKTPPDLVITLAKLLPDETPKAA